MWATVHDQFCRVAHNALPNLYLSPWSITTVQSVLQMDTRPHACGYMATWSQRFSSGYLTSRYTCDLICIPLEASSALWPIEQNQTLCTVPINKKMVEIRLQTFNIGLPHFSQIQIRIPWDQHLFEIICFNGTRSRSENNIGCWSELGPIQN